MKNNNVDAAVVMKSLEKLAAPQIKQISSLTIKSKDDYATAAELMRSVKNIAKQAKEKEESLTEPLKQVIKDIQSLFKPFRNQVAELEADTKAKMLAFVASTTKQIQAVNERFENGDIKKVSTVISKTNALEIDSNVRKTWKAVPVNPTQTPREYCIPDEVKIREALKAGKSVRGWEWRQVESISI